MVGGRKEFVIWVLRIFCVYGCVFIEFYLVFISWFEDVDVCVFFRRSYIFRFYCFKMIRYNFLRLGQKIFQFFLLFFQSQFIKLKKKKNVFLNKYIKLDFLKYLLLKDGLLKFQIG